jgi:hypothetical protein
MEKKIIIPKGKLADAASDKRRELREKLLNGGKIVVGRNGNVTNNPVGETHLTVPMGKLADAAADKRQELRQKLLNGDRIFVGNNGNVTNNPTGETSITVPRGKLASQWYETNPDLLDAEVLAMNKCFPNFELQKLDDGKLAWIGTINTGIYESKFGIKREYNLMAVYQPNHPNVMMGSSVYVYPILPDADEMREEFNKKFGDPHIHHLLRDSNNNLNYLCTTEAQYVHDGSDSITTTAASVLGWAVKWLMSYELVLTGDLERAKFNESDGI